jgi:hypothetical protein
MKKITLILLISIYALSVLGYSVNESYCCGNLESVTLGFPHQNQGSHARGISKGKCCTTQYQSFQVKDNHLASDYISLPLKHFISLYFLYPTLLKVVTFPSQNYAIAFSGNAPPTRTALRVHLFNCVFLI